MKKLTLLAILGLLITCSAYAQLTVIGDTSSQSLSQTLAGSGVSISNWSTNCDSAASGRFTNGNTTNLGFNEGVVLSTGRALDGGFGGFGVANPSATFASTSFNGTGDADLTNLINTFNTTPGQTFVTNDGCILEFDLRVDGDTLKFDYVFGSEEYTNFVCTQFTDVFGFFISGPNPLGGSYASQNIAIVPNSTYPVAINSVNGGNSSGTNTPCILTNTAYYVNNTGNDIVFDGFTTPLVAEIPVIPCNVYHLKLAIADVSDWSYDSGVFLRANSFSATNVNILPGTSATQGFQNAVEGCNTSGFTLQIDNILTDSFTIDYQIGGTATLGADYPAIPTSVTIAPGDSTAFIEIIPIDDQITEPYESVKLYLINTCTNTPYDSAVIFIQDTVVAVTASPDVTICRGESTVLNAQGGLLFNWTPPATLSNPTAASTVASPLNTTTYAVRVDVGLCYDIDSITVTVVDAEFTIEAGPDDTICRFGTSPINLTIVGNQSPYSFQWSPDSTLSSGTVQNPVAQPQSSELYNVTVTGANGCTLRDSLRVFVIGQGPFVTISSDKNDVCVGDTVHLLAQIFPKSCGLNVVPCTGAYDIKTAGTGTNTFGPSPYRGFYHDARTQILYKASELQAAGLQAGTITDIGFDMIAQASSIPYDNFTVKMGCTDVDALTDFVPGLSVVAPATQFIPAGPGINNHNLANPYDWDGYSNLIIEICFDNTQFTNDDNVSSTVTGYNSVIQASQDFAVGCDLDAATSFPFISQERPNTQFVFCVDPPLPYSYSWSPTAGLVNPDSLNPSTAVVQNTTYSIVVTDSVCEGGAFINLRTANYGINAGNDTVVCNGQGVQLNAAVTGTPPSGALNCGVNGTACSGAATAYEFGLNPLFLNNSPFDGFFEDSRCQLLYRASDLQALGMTAGVISSLEFNVTFKLSTLPYQNLNVGVGCTNKTDLDFTTWEPTQSVYNNANYSTVTGWNTIPFLSNYDWDGSSNIVVEICWDNPDLASAGNTDYLLGVNTPYTSNNLALAFTDAGCGLDVSAAIQSTSLPAMRFNVCPGPPLVPNVSWSPGAGLNSTTILNPLATPAQSTSYVITADFPGGCIWYDTIAITTATLNYTISNDTAFCAGGAAQLEVIGADAVSWNNATPGLSCYNCANPTATPVVDALYVATISNAAGCTVLDSVNIDISTLFTGYTISPDTTFCAGNSVQLNVTGAATVQWDNIPGLSCYTCPDPVANPTDTTTYYVDLADAGGCTNRDTVTIFVREMDAFTLFNDTLIDQGTNITLYADATGGYGTYAYSWTPNTYLEDANVQNPEANTVISDIVYIVNVTSGDCADSDSVRVRVNIIESPVALPDAFTPNGDGRNDGFFPYIPNGSLATVKEFRIYNRWGEVVHEGNTPWTGDYKGKPQPIGNYQYYIVVARPFVPDQVVQGGFTLLR
jgi:gliding motility-associated-like protein